MIYPKIIGPINGNGHETARQAVDDDRVCSDMSTRAEPRAKNI